MNLVANEMAQVSRCEASSCSYNVNKSCHAKAITVGDLKNPECDTYLSGTNHNKETRRIAGVGACKVIKCKFNQDLECAAEKISVGFSDNQVKCLTYVSR